MAGSGKQLVDGQAEESSPPPCAASGPTVLSVKMADAGVGDVLQELWHFTFTQRTESASLAFKSFQESRMYVQRCASPCSPFFVICEGLLGQ